MDATFEIYPLGGHLPTTGTRIGFSVDDVDGIVPTLAAVGGSVVSPPEDIEWGRHAVVQDPDGHLVDLITPPNRDRVVASDRTFTGVITETHSDGMFAGDFDRR